MLVKVKFANIINIAAEKEIIPELLQSKCNSKNISLSKRKIYIYYYLSIAKKPS